MKPVLFSVVLIFSSLAFAKQVPLDLKASSIEWLGQKKVPGGDHKGTVSVKKGTVNIDENANLTGGTIVIDMTKIVDTDLSGKWKKKLEDHLNGPDFFDVSNHKEATFKITKVEKTRSNLYKVTGDLTVRGKINQETFELKVSKEGKTLVAMGKLQFNRTKYGVMYNSEASVLKKAISIPKDKVIKDTISLDVKLQTEKI